MTLQLYLEHGEGITEDKGGLWDIADGLILRIINNHHAPVELASCSIHAAQPEPEPEQMDQNDHGQPVRSPSDPWDQQVAVGCIPAGCKPDAEPLVAMELAVELDCLSELSLASEDQYDLWSAQRLKHLD